MQVPPDMATTGVVPVLNSESPSGVWQLLILHSVGQWKFCDPSFPFCQKQMFNLAKNDHPFFVDNGLYGSQENLIWVRLSPIVWKVVLDRTVLLPGVIYISLYVWILKENRTLSVWAMIPLNICKLPRDSVIIIIVFSPYVVVIIMEKDCFPFLL